MELEAFACCSPYISGNLMAANQYDKTHLRPVMELEVFVCHSACVLGKPTAAANQQNAIPLTGHGARSVRPSSSLRFGRTDDGGPAECYPPPIGHRARSIRPSFASRFGIIGHGKPAGCTFISRLGTQFALQSSVKESWRYHDRTPQNRKDEGRGPGTYPIAQHGARCIPSFA